MKKEHAQKWVDALRSGKYKQGAGRLKIVHDDTKEERFCCLGVLCEIFPELELNKRISDNGLVEQHDGILCGYKKIGLSHETGIISHLISSGPDNLTNLNDSGKNFNELADIIEKEYIFEQDLK